MFTTRTKFHKPNYNGQLDNSMKPKAKHISTSDGYFVILHPPRRVPLLSNTSSQWRIYRDPSGCCAENPKTYG